MGVVAVVINLKIRQFENLIIITKPNIYEK